MDFIKKQINNLIEKKENCVNSVMLTGLSLCPLGKLIGLFPAHSLELQLQMGVSCRETDARSEVGVKIKPVKSHEMRPLNNHHPNQFVRRPGEADGLQRNVLSGRSLGTSKSISHTNTRAGETAGEMSARDSTEERDAPTNNSV